MACKGSSASSVKKLGFGRVIASGAKTSDLGTTFRSILRHIYIEARSCAWRNAFVFDPTSSQDGRVEDACTACCLVNDLYDYQRDKDVAEQLSVWHYFDSVDDAIDYVRDYYYEVYDRVGPELQHFLDLTMMYQQDRKTHEIRGFDSEWYGRLNANFNRHLGREPRRQSHVEQWCAPRAL